MRKVKKTRESSNGAWVWVCVCNMTTTNKQTKEFTALTRQPEEEREEEEAPLKVK